MSLCASSKLANLPTPVMANRAAPNAASSWCCGTLTGKPNLLERMDLIVRFFLTPLPAATRFFSLKEPAERTGSAKSYSSCAIPSIKPSIIAAGVKLSRLIFSIFPLS